VELATAAAGGSQDSANSRPRSPPNRNGVASYNNTAAAQRRVPLLRVASSFQRLGSNRGDGTVNAENQGALPTSQKSALREDAMPAAKLPVRQRRPFAAPRRIDNNELS
jgi:hypothetical protein